MPPQASKKRKDPPSKPQARNLRPHKRIKLHQARTILTEPPDRALNQNGDLDVAAFVKAREFEIRALSKSMESSKAVLSTRAFQHVPRSMRRRTASHNVKKVPKRLRLRSAKEIREDNTPTGKDRCKKPTTHKRLRLEKAKALKKKGRLKKAQRKADQKSKPVEKDPEKMVRKMPRLPKAKKGVLVAPSRPPARYRKRQVHKSWLPTHVWHAKRAHMTEPLFPLWRFAIPLSPSEKAFRTTHRAANMRGCVAWDTSYMSTIGLEGAEASMIGLLRSMGFQEEMLTGSKGRRWRQGSRSHECWVRERDKNEMFIAPVTVVWCANADEPTEGLSEARKKKVKRKCLLRVHPSAFFQVWNDLVKVAKMQRPQIVIEDLRFDIGSIEVTGAGSTEALLAALHPLPEKLSDPTQATASSVANDTVDMAADALAQELWEDFETPAATWTKLAGLTNSASLPPRALLGFNISDPRLRAPVRTIPVTDPETANNTFMDLLADWPPDWTQKAADIFDHTKRLTASRLLSSQKSINRRKSACPLGTTPPASPRDPRIPVLLYTSRPPASAVKSGQGKWTVLLPWSCVLPVWYTLMHYPLSSGETPRFGCLSQQRQIAFENNMPWFPGDFPGTKAGWEWECMERRVAKQQWDRKPKGRRIEYDSVKLGEERKKGEVGKGWACDWEMVVLGKEKYEELEAKSENTAIGEEYTIASQAGDAVEPSSFDPQTAISIPTGPPHGLVKYHIPPSPTPPRLDRTKIPRTALVSVLIHLLPSGHPSRCARIYRLPTQDPELRARWLAVLKTQQQTRHPNEDTNNRNRAQGRKPAGKGKHHISSARVTSTSTPLVSLPPNKRAQHMAQNLFSDLPSQSSTFPSSSSNLPAYSSGFNDQTHALPPPVPESHDLIGFVTSANYNLSAGRCGAVGNILLWKGMGWDAEAVEGDAHTERPTASSTSGAAAIGGASNEGKGRVLERSAQPKGKGKRPEPQSKGGEKRKGEKNKDKEAAPSLPLPTPTPDAPAPTTTTTTPAPIPSSTGSTGGDNTTKTPNPRTSPPSSAFYCIIRDAGLPTARLARWEFASTSYC